MKFIPVFDIKVGQREKKYVNECLKNSWLGQGHYVSKFENKLRRFINSRYGSFDHKWNQLLYIWRSATIGLKEGDEVLVSSSTNMASVFSIVYCGAKPIPIDISRENWQMNINDLKKVSQKNQKAIMVVHLFGHAVDMDPILRIAKTI